LKRTSNEGQREKHRRQPFEIHPINGKLLQQRPILGRVRPNISRKPLELWRHLFIVILLVHRYRRAFVEKPPFA
jgi:hypothetical protein